MSKKQFGLDDATRNKIKQVIDSHINIDEAVIYGSRAKGNFKPGSDIDICLKGPSLTLHELNQIVQQLDELDLPYQMDVSIYHQIDNPELIDHIDRVGQRFN